jgi:CheY-like chemotaxis protein
MKVIKNPVLGTWELAESEGPISNKNRGSRPCDPRRVLIVDDEEQNRRLYATIIRQAFPSVACDLAPDGLRAVEQFITHHPLVVVMDVVMPNLDGEEAYYQIEEHCQVNAWQQPRVIFCTGHAPSVGLRNVAASDPANCLLQKPIRKRILITALSKRLNLAPVSVPS